jgi:hypothetical protein
MQLNRKRRQKDDYDDEFEQSTQMRFDDSIEEFLALTRRLLVVGVIDEMSSTHVCNYLQQFYTRKETIYM